MSFWVDENRQLVIYPGDPGVLEQYIPDLKRLNGSYFCVPKTLPNLQVLRYYNFEVPEVMVDYDWPAPPGFKPYESQKLTANFLVTHRKCFCLSDMGVGKTSAALWGSDWLMRQYPAGEFKTLIVAPLSILQRVWGDGIFKNFLGRRKFEILHGTPKQRIEALQRDADYYICNVDGLGVGAHTRKKFELDGFSKMLAERSDIKLAIVDEASTYRDARTKKHRIARHIVGTREYTWMMTGTPCPNAPTDAYGLAKLVNNAYGQSFTTFQLRTMYKATQFKWVPQKDGYAKAQQLLTPAIRIPIETVWDAPPTTTQQRQVDLTAEQQKLLAALKKDLQVVVKSGDPITAVNEAAARQKFLQIVMGAVYDSEHKSHHVASDPRLQEVEEIIESTTRKVVIFVPLTNVINMLEKQLKKRWKCAVINGPVSAKDRSALISQFAEDDSLRIMIADPGTTAHGINEFVVADTIIWYGPCEKNELYIQGNKRVNRPGQKYPNTIVQIVATRVEQEIYKRLETNGSMQGLLLKMVTENGL